MVGRERESSSSTSMFDSISWGELIVLGGLGFVLVGRKDLPRVSRLAGTQLGRVVGLLQGARARADQFATNNELKQLQNELRSGLRELDQVKTELAVAASSQGMVGRNLGATVAAVNRQKPLSSGSGLIGGSTSGSLASTGSSSSIPPVSMSPPLSNPISPTTKETDGDFVTLDIADPTQRQTIALERISSSEAQSERAVLEEEWVQQGIGFKARAEMMGNNDQANTTNSDIPKSGSEILENLIKQNLIFDQYDRVVGKQEQEMKDRIDAIKEKRKPRGESGRDA